MNRRKHQEVYRLCIIVIGVFVSSLISRAHDEKLHARMSQQAASSSDNLDRFARDNFVDDYTWVNTKFTYDSKTLSVIDWIEQGSKDEDHGSRSRQHFYIPSRPDARPLTDPPTNVPGESPPVTSYAWASTAADNAESWQKARVYQFQALTGQAQVTRDANWGHTFKSVGHVIHLNQDLSQPGHTRDDNHAHLDVGPVRLYYVPAGPGSPIEDYGLKYLENALKSGDWTTAFPGSPLPWSYWQTAGFKKLEDFWDRKLYNGHAPELDDSESPLQPSKKLGLGEWSNGNFLSEDALYEEINRFDPSPYRHWFQFPSLRTGTDFETVFRKPSTSARPQLLRNGTIINTAYIDKTGEGVKVENHAALRYFKVKRPEIYPYGIDINNDKVLQAYHEKLIPKAIEYSAGILDYFFRGKFGLCMAPGATPGKYNLRITNESGQDLKGGEFRLYWDDASGVRTRLTGDDFSITWSETSPLADNAPITAECTAQANAVSYTLVYKGTIGTADGTQPQDLVDGQIAIAAATTRMEGCTALNGTGQLTGDSLRATFRPGSYAGSQVIHAVAGEHRALRIRLNSEGFDTYLYLLDACGNLWAENDDSGGNLNSEIVFKIPVSGEYQVEASSFSDDMTGDYQLTVECGYLNEQQFGQCPGRAEQFEIEADQPKYFASTLAQANANALADVPNLAPSYCCPPNSAPIIEQLVWTPTRDNQLGVSAAGGVIQVDASVAGTDAEFSSFTSTLCVAAPPEQNYTVEISWDLTWTTRGDGFAYDVYFELHEGTDVPAFFHGGVFNWDGPTRFQGGHTFEVNVANGRQGTDLSFLLGAANSTVSGTITITTH